MVARFSPTPSRWSLVRRCEAGRVAWRGPGAPGRAWDKPSMQSPGGEPSAGSSQASEGYQASVTSRALVWSQVGVVARRGPSSRFMQLGGSISSSSCRTGRCRQSRDGRQQLHSPRHAYAVAALPPKIRMIRNKIPVVDVAPWPLTQFQPIERPGTSAARPTMRSTTRPTIVSRENVVSATASPYRGRRPQRRPFPGGSAFDVVSDGLGTPPPLC